MARSELELSGFPENDGFPAKTEGVDSAHALAAGLLADHEKEGDIPLFQLACSAKFLDGDELGGETAFCVYGAAAGDEGGVVAQGVRDKGGYGVEVGC